MSHTRSSLSKLSTNSSMWSKWNSVRLYANYRKIFKTLSTYYNVSFCMWNFFYNLSMRATIGLLNIFHKYMCTSFSVLYLQLSVIIVQWLQVLEAIQGSSCQSHVKCSQSPDISTVLERKFKIHRASIRKSDLGMTLNEYWTQENDGHSLYFAHFAWSISKQIIFFK